VPTEDLPVAQRDSLFYLTTVGSVFVFTCPTHVAEQRGSVANVSCQTKLELRIRERLLSQDDTLVCWCAGVLLLL
jgi:hypothetical protein